MTTTALVLSPVNDIDPRLTLDDNALVEASRNAYPVVASRKAKRDNLGLAAGGAIALALGGLVFYSMSSGRTTPKPKTETATAPVNVPVQPVAEQPQQATNPPAPNAQPAPSGGTMPASVVPSLPMTSAPVNRASSPVMVFDNSSAPSSMGSAPPSGVITPISPAATTGLSPNEMFAERVGSISSRTASAVAMQNPGYVVPQGALLPAVTETAIDSDLPGFVRAVVSQDVRSFDGKRVLIPRSSRLIGQYKSGLDAGQRRVYVLWTRLIRPDGVSVELGSPSTDYEGRSGLSGEVDTHFMSRFGSAMLLSVIGGLSSGGTSYLIGGSSAASVAAQSNAQIPPTVRVRQGQPIRVFIAKDLDFSTLKPANEVAG